MVAITRSAAARQQQSPNTKNVVVSVRVSKISGKKKKIAKQDAPSPIKLLSTQPIITTTVAPAIFGTLE